jgi:NADP-dependent 3-hydroxy acid dehydrogenase YdfG
MQTAIITGASSGIGAACAKALARAKWRLVVSGKSSTRLSEVTQECRTLGAPAVLPVAVDFMSERSIETFVNATEGFAPVVDALINSAGIAGLGDLAGLSVRDIENTVRLNLVVPLALSGALLSRLGQAGRVGTIVNMSSDADTLAFGAAAVYSGTKGGLLAASRALRIEAVRKGVRVVVVSPGRVDTRFNNREVGDRPGALSADSVASVVLFAVTCSPDIDLQEVRLDSMWRDIS